MEKQGQTIVHKHYYFRWIVQFVCVVCAFKLMSAGIKGWGWLLFVAVML